MPWHSQTRTLKLSHELSDELCFPPTHAVLLSPSAIMQESDPVLSDRASGSADEFVAEPQLADGVEALLKRNYSGVGK